MGSPFFLEELIQHLNTAHQTTYTAGDRYRIGEQGAYKLIDAERRRYVLKWQPGTGHLERALYARAVTAQLRQRGYPAPAYVHIGTALGGTYSIQQALPGAPMQRVSLRHLPRILQLQALHAVQAPPGPRDWPREVIQTVMQGGQGYCLHSSLQQHSPETASMLRALQGLVSAYQDRITETNEIVHFDFQPANFLIYQDAISGVVDWEGVCAGDSAFDLATLLFYTYDDKPVRDLLWKHALARRSMQVLSVYLAHLILRQVDWSLRHHEASVSDRYRARARALLAEIKARP
jgi:aminoglycoside phosphotransferase (APT) family kinase protein